MATDRLGRTGTPPAMFPDISPIGYLPSSEQRSVLEELGEEGDLEVAGPELPNEKRRGLFWDSAPKAWQYISHQFGFIPLAKSGGEYQIKEVSEIPSDDGLKGQRIDIKLDRLRIFEYPGSGQHRIMFTFKAQNQLEDMPEPVSFSQVFRARNRETIPLRGVPVFIGLSVGGTGALFQGFTVNVKNDDDERFLGMLESDVFKSGLSLLTTAQPALQPLSQLTLGLTKTLASRNKNVAVQDFYLGLDFANSPFGASLAQGNYVAVQVPSITELKWPDWVYEPSVGTIVQKSEPTRELPYNYVVFRVRRSGS